MEFWATLGKVTGAVVFVLLCGCGVLLLGFLTAPLKDRQSSKMWPWQKIDKGDT